MIYCCISPLLPLHQLLSEGKDTQSSRHPEDGERETARKEEGERGDGAEPSLILPLQPPDEHPPYYHPWGTQNSWQCHVYYL